MAFICPNCGTEYMLSEMANVGGYLAAPTHDFPKDSGKPCPGSLQRPRMFDSKSGPGYADMADHDEDVRINVIGKSAMNGRKVGFIVDDIPGKADRYIRKLTQRFPEIKVTARGKGPVPKTIAVCVERMNTENEHE